MAKILLHSLVFPPDGNSNAYVMADLACALKAYGHELTVLTTTPHYHPVKEDLDRQPMTPVKGDWLLKSDFHGIPCYHVRVAPKKGGMGMRLKTALRFHALSWWATRGAGWKFDVVLSQSPPLTMGLVGSWIARRSGGKSIYVVQDVFPDGLIRQGKISNPALIAGLRRLERAVYSHSDTVCGISQGITEVLRPRVPSSTHLEVIPNFVNTDIYHPLPRENHFSQTHHLADRFVISYVGNIGNAQDFSPVLAAARECRDLPITLLMVGDGIKRTALEAQVASEGLTNISFLGYQPRELTPQINAASDVALVLLAPHVGSFSFPSKIYTLMASGKPIVLVADPASDVARLVTELGVGVVVPIGDQEAFVHTLRHLYAQRASLAEYGARGWAAVQAQFSVQQVAQRYHDVMMRMVTSP